MQYYIWHSILIVTQCSGSERFLWEAPILWKWQGTIAGLSKTQRTLWKVSPKILYSSTHIFWIVYWLFICSQPSWWQCVFFLIHNTNSWITIFFDRDGDKKIEITKKLVHLHIKLGEVVEVHILCEFFFSANHFVQLTMEAQS